MMTGWRKYVEVVVVSFVVAVSVSVGILCVPSPAERADKRLRSDIAAAMSAPKKVVSTHVGIATLTGSGSGVFIDNDKILTAKHVVEDSAPQWIRVLVDGEWVNVSDVVSYANQDAAVLVLTESFDVVLPEVSMRPLEVGEEVETTGVPRGGMFGFLYRRGYVMTVDTYGPYSEVLVDLEVTTGDSGSGVFRDGKLVGITVGIVINVGNQWGVILPVESFKVLL